MSLLYNYSAVKGFGMERSSLLNVLSTAFATAVWGTTYVVTTLWLPDGYPLWSGLLRALPAGLLGLALSRRLPSGVWWWRSLVLGTLTIGAFLPLLFVAAYTLPGGVAAVFGATQPLIVAGLALVVLAERPTRWRLAWALLAVVGVAVLVLGPASAFSPLGVAAGFGSTVCMSLGTVLSKKWGRPVGALAYASWMLTAGGLVIVPLALAVEGGPPPLDGAAAGAYLWLGLVGGLLAYLLWFRGVSALPAGAVSFLPLVSPLVAAILGLVVLGETLSPLQWAGFGLAMLAVAASQRA